MHLKYEQKHKMVALNLDAKTHSLHAGYYLNALPYLCRMETFELSEDYIHLNQLLKAMGWCNDGGQANAMIDDGLVKVNGIKELRRRNKITAGMVVELEGKKVTVKKS